MKRLQSRSLRICFTWLLPGLLSACSARLLAQPAMETIYSRFAMYDERQKLDRSLREQTITGTFSQEIDSLNEYRFEGACWAISQFMIANEDVEMGFRKMLDRYPDLQVDTRRALLEAIYGVYPQTYAAAMQEVWLQESDPKLLAMAGLYLFRLKPTAPVAQQLWNEMKQRIPGADTLAITREFHKYLLFRESHRSSARPDLRSLLQHQKTHGKKVVYSFQRWNRDYPGMVVVQGEDGKLIRDAAGRIRMYQQLARSASDLPYFITNGSTPQGIYSVQGVAVSKNNFIGPTPNLQLLMPHEGDWERYFHIQPPQQWDTLKDPIFAYTSLLPFSWRTYLPMQEAFYAGRIGRTEIIAHGTTIDPEYFRDKPYYPLTPTLGCLCAREEWNVTTGRPTISEQLGLVQAYQSTPGSKGYLIVINLDDQQQAVTRPELERLLKEAGF